MKKNSEKTLCSCLNVKEFLARNRCDIWKLSGCNGIRERGFLNDVFGGTNYKVGESHYEVRHNNETYSRAAVSSIFHK